MTSAIKYDTSYLNSEIARCRAAIKSIDSRIKECNTSISDGNENTVCDILVDLAATKSEIITELNLLIAKRKVMNDIKRRQARTVRA